MNQQEQPRAGAFTGSFLFAALLGFAAVLTACSPDKTSNTGNVSDATPKAPTSPSTEKPQ
jgi:hypothetical protein